MRQRDGDSLEHRIGPEFVEHGGVGHPEKPVDYVNDPVGGGDVGGDDGGVYAATLHGDGLIPVRGLHHVEEQPLLVGGGRHLQEFQRVSVRKCSTTRRRVTRVNRQSRARL